MAYLLLDKTKISIAACAIGTLATVGVAQSQAGPRQLRTAGVAALQRGEDKILAVDARSDASAKRLVSYLKKSGASYYLEMRNARGRVTKISSGGSVPMASLRLVKEGILKWRNPGIPQRIQPTCPTMIWGDFNAMEISRVLQGVGNRVVQIEDMRVGVGN